MKNNTTLRRVAGALFVIAAALGVQGRQASPGVTVIPADAISQKATQPKVIAEARKANDNRSPYRYGRRGILNQRQYRKLLRQNPHFRRSKKCKL